MCIVLPDNPLAKGVVTYCLDEISTRENAQSILKSLRDGIKQTGPDFSGLQDALASHLFKMVYDDAKKIDKFRVYLRDYWFDPESDKIEFKDIQPIAPVYAEGLLKTIDLALSKNLPIDSWWLVDYPGIQMLNLVSDHQVTLIIATPRPKTMAPKGIWNPTAEAWCTRHVSAKGAVETRQIENRRKD